MSRCRPFYAGAALATIALGLFSRRPGWPEWVYLYVGDALYATMALFWAGSLFPKVPPRRLALASLTTCWLIEFSQAWHPLWLDDLRENRLVALVLGRGFVASDLLCYCVGAGLGHALDLRLIGEHET